ncbi:MAG TPA: HAD hydrolase-like protein [Solirubrobacteraceae bacterium]
MEATKPEPDLLRAALERAGADGETAVMVGDTPWDVKAAQGADVPTIAVVTGGFAAQELRDAGADAVFESVAELCERLNETALG